MHVHVAERLGERRIDRGGPRRGLPHGNEPVRVLLLLLLVRARGAFTSRKSRCASHGEW